MRSAGMYVDEEALIKRLAPRLEERITYNVIQSIVETLEESFYPPEDMIREEFIQEVKEAEKEEGKVFKNIEELRQHLESLGG